ncbi:hypothetical protein OOK31_32700 [Streptomyces sp. NBC_00249]|uniref:hypothetical protein n=1 Tax=Streptomyces sp. NBC_00249 TaxID=2975690 RepID=UPI002251EDB7|nr:hypothetical protein [Streptomyces sp. NBC_00249]MCX5198594.1 hypothetical protein [Streptomyces sp. NBC_00249]
MAVAPLICNTIPFSGPVKKEYEQSFSVAVSESTTVGREVSLTAEASLTVKGVGGKIGGTVKWSNSTTNSMSVTKSGSDKTSFEVQEGKFRKLDTRLCAGVGG